jgi:hypothetical protein
MVGGRSLAGWSDVLVVEYYDKSDMSSHRSDQHTNSHQPVGVHESTSPFCYFAPQGNRPAEY